MRQRRESSRAFTSAGMVTERCTMTILSGTVLVRRRKRLPSASVPQEPPPQWAGRSPLPAVSKSPLEMSEPPAASVAAAFSWRAAVSAAVLAARAAAASSAAAFSGAASMGRSTMSSRSKVPASTWKRAGMNLRMRPPSGTRNWVERETQPLVSLPVAAGLGWGGPILPRSASVNSSMMRASNQEFLPRLRPVTRWRQVSSRASTPCGMVISRYIMTVAPGDGLVRRIKRLPSSFSQEPPDLSDGQPSGQLSPSESISMAELGMREAGASGVCACSGSKAAESSPAASRRPRGRSWVTLGMGGKGPAGR